MENEIIKLLDSNLKCIDCRIKDEQIILEVSSSALSTICPYCGSSSAKVHSTYKREIQDLPLQDKQTILLLNTRRMFCNNKQCNHTTFSERFSFVDTNGKKTKRLAEKILMTSVKLSSVSASTLLEADSVKVCKSSICDLLKKMPDIVDKSFVTEVCVEDFAFRKRYTYGSVMVDWESRQIVDIIDSRETKQVEEWLKSYPNIQIIS